MQGYLVYDKTKHLLHSQYFTLRLEHGQSVRRQLLMKVHEHFRFAYRGNLCFTISIVGSTLPIFETSSNVFDHLLISVEKRSYLQPPWMTRQCFTP